MDSGMDTIKKNLQLNSQIVICDDSYIEIERCKRIMGYNDIYLKLKISPTFFVEIWGSGLTISDYGDCGIAVRGKIMTIELHG